MTALFFSSNGHGNDYLAIPPATMTTPPSHNAGHLRSISVDKVP